MSNNRLKNYVLTQVDSVILDCQTLEEYRAEIDELLHLAADLMEHAEDDWRETHEEAKDL